MFSEKSRSAEPEKSLGSRQENKAEEQSVVDSAKGRRDSSKPAVGVELPGSTSAKDATPRWRTWFGDPHSPGTPVEVGTRSDIPRSTANIPLTLFKRVNVQDLDSISRGGLRFEKGNVLFRGFAKGSVYVNRDAALKAVWLGTTEEPGESMESSSGQFTNLTVTVTKEFVGLHIRDANAVLHGDDAKSGTTVLSFADIPADQITLTLTDDEVAKLKKLIPSTKLEPGDVPLKKIIPAEFRQLIGILGAPDR